MEVVLKNYRLSVGSMKVVAVNYRFRSENMEIGTDRTHLPLLELYCSDEAHAALVGLPQTSHTSVSN